MEKLYTKGPAAYGSVERLKRISGQPKHIVEKYLNSLGAHTKYRNVRRNFPRLKVIAYRINEIWSIDLADVSKLQKYNKGIRFLLFAVDVLSRYLRVEPMKNKTAEETAAAFKRMIKYKQPEKVWSDRGNEFKGEFAELCKKKGIEIYHTNSETKSAFAERYIRTVQGMSAKSMEKRWTYDYLSDIPEHVKTINNRVHSVTGLAPSKVFKKHTPYLVSLTNGSHLIQKPNFKIGDIVRIAKKDLPFKKGYQQQFTDETFQIYRIATLNPPTYNIQDEANEKILGKFYEAEITKVETDYGD